MRGLIVEGVTASGKSTLLRLLQRRLADEHPDRTKLFLSEHYTERILEDERASGILTFEKALNHITDVVATLQHVARWKTDNKFALTDGNAGIAVLVERFYGSHVANICVSQRGELCDDIFRRAVEIYRQIREMGFIVIILTVEPKDLSALINDSRFHRNQAWNAYLDSIGDAAAILAHYSEWQERLLTFYAAIADRSQVDIRHFHTTTMTHDEIARELFSIM